MPSIGTQAYRKFRRPDTTLVTVVPDLDLRATRDPEKVTPHRFTTASVPRRDQHEAWREWFGSVFEVVPRDPPGEGFRAENEVWQLGAVTMSRVSGPAVQVSREKTHLRRDPVDHWVLSYCRRGASIIRTRSGSIRAPAGVPYLWSLCEESESARTAVDRIQLFLPRDLFRDIAPLLDPAIGSILDTPLGSVLGDFMLALERHLPSLTASDLPRLAEAAGGLIAACVAPSMERIAEARSQIDFGRMERLRQMVRKHLRSPTLGPESLCRLVGVSRSHLYRMLEGSGGAARYIQRQRLLEAHRVLCDAAIARPIFAIAEDFCFEDASSFSRAFRREFGLSPSDVRSAALAGLSPTAMPKRYAASEAGTFGSLLRSF
jgi:AraC-like DNA-binding protein